MTEYRTPVRVGQVRPKLKPLYSPFIDTPVIDRTLVYKVNAFPGTGKTYFAWKECILKVLCSPNPGDTVVVYAAPTLLLLNQVISDIYKELAATPELLARNRAALKRMHLVVSKQNAMRAENRPPKGPASGYLNWLIRQVPDGTRTQDQLRRLFNMRPALQGGNVIFTTHETVVSATTAEWKSRCSLIFDEARSCLVDNCSIDITKELYDYLYSTCSVTPVGGRSNGFLRWNSAAPLNRNKSGELVKDGNEFSALTKSALIRSENLKRFLDSIENPLVDVWTTKATLTDDGFIHVHVILCPSYVFYGWGKVLCLSAFFDKSQMGHYLESMRIDPDSPDPLIEGHPWYRVEIMDVTKQVVDPLRMEQAKNRLENAWITYVFDENQISMNALAYGLVLPKTTRQEAIYAAHRDWGVAYRRLTSGAINTKIKLSKNARPTPYRLLVERSADVPSVASTALAPILERLKPLRTSVATYMALSAARLSEMWHKRRKLPHAPLLCAMNQSDAVQRNKSVLETYGIDKIVNKARKRCEFPAKMMVHGLNRYTNLRSAAFLASLRMEPSQARLFKEIIPGYNADIDRTVDHCIQFLWRTNIRDPESRKACLFIVTDKTVAEAVQKQLGYELRVVPPEKIIPDWKPCVVETFRGTADDRELDRHRKKAKKSYDTNPALANAERSMRRAKAALDQDPTNSKKKATYDKHRKRVADLKTPKAKEEWE